MLSAIAQNPSYN
jgi:hypothetical protein